MALYTGEQIDMLMIKKINVINILHPEHPHLNKTSAHAFENDGTHLPIIVNDFNLYFAMSQRLSYKICIHLHKYNRTDVS